MYSKVSGGPRTTLRSLFDESLFHGHCVGPSVDWSLSEISHSHCGRSPIASDTETCIWSGRCRKRLGRRSLWRPMGSSSKCGSSNGLA